MQGLGKEAEEEEEEEAYTDSIICVFLISARHIQNSCGF